MGSHRLHPALVVAVATTLAGAVTPAVAQQAQSPPEETQQEVEQVTVTGSRIVRKDFSSDSPTVTVSTEALQNTSEVGIDQQLNKLPQFVPGANQVTSALDVQATPTNSPGISTVNLRGLGANRTLVLLDGRRTQPNNASLVVDINTIPQAAIDGVEIITGGAGATYGADAVAGVVNFRLKKNFQGVTLDAQSGRTTEGDGQQSTISLLLGSNFADNRGNAMIGLNYSKRDEVYARDRDFFARANSDPGTPGTDGFPNFGGFVSSATNSPQQSVLNSIFGAKGYSAGDVPASSIIYFNPAAATSASTVFSLTPGAVSKMPAPGYTGGFGDDYKLLTNGTLSSNSPNGFLSLPLTRYSLFANGHYDLNDHVSFYVQANFDQNQTTTMAGNHAPAANQWSVNIPVDAGHPVSTLR